MGFETVTLRKPQLTLRADSGKRLALKAFTRTEY